MQTTENVICVMQTLGSKGEPLTRIYRQLYNENLYISAYSRLYANKGALTPGVTNETVDGMNLTKIRAIIAKLRRETYRWTPVRRRYRQRKDGKMRPLGLPTWSDKLLEEVIRILLEAHYEPIFSTHSHGYRQHRGCHTALQEIVTCWTGTAWFIEGDIKGCFDHINHDVLMAILAKHIQDKRLLRLLRYRLESGIMEDWQYRRTHSGTPQGGVLSPLLANIYLHELDNFIEEMLIPQWNKGKKRTHNRTYVSIRNKINTAKRHNDQQAAKEWTRALRQTPSQDMFDPDFRRLKYVRYADDFVLGFIGNKAEAQEILAQIEIFLGQTLRLQMSKSKSKITHAKSDYARFLGYDIGAYGNVVDKITQNHRGKRRSANGRIILRLPANYVEERCREWQKKGKPRINGLAITYSVEESFTRYQTQFRGIVNYYQYAVDVHELARLKYAMEQSLVHSLAAKLKISVSKVYRKYRARITVNEQSYTVLQSVVRNENGRELTFTWGGIPLKRRRMFSMPIRDQIAYGYQGRSELVARMLATKCELCGKETNELEGHHVKKLADLPKKWRKGRTPQWALAMIARRRKTLFVCKPCHVRIHTKSV
ncbi:MAG: hypothetical protein H8D37_03835 [Chloroflexi bacterium]|nr:hypothetical protein [Chloroflexota bacterium]